MRAVMLWCFVLFLATIVVCLSADQARQIGGAVLFEGARLITGDGRAPIESSAFLVEGQTGSRRSAGKARFSRRPARRASI